MNEIKGKRALIILGHGSRAAGAADDMEKVALKLKERLDYEIVETCQMSGKGALFPEIFDRCMEQGAASVLVLPYFLHRGVHMLLDVPGMMQEKAEAYPGVKVVLGSNLGFDEALVDIMIKRVRESELFGDVREVDLPNLEDQEVD